jgi:hypothetical protein
MRATTCGYCNVDTAGNHEQGCPCFPTQTVVTASTVTQPELRFTVEQIADAIERNCHPLFCTTREIADFVRDWKGEK